MAEQTIALLVAAGKSERLGFEIPKPYIPLARIAILTHAIKLFQSHPRIDGVRVVIRRQDHPRYKAATSDLTLFPPVVGGNTRQESVRLGLESIAHRNPQRVLVHDAARPLTSHALIDRVLDALDAHDAVIPALPVIDTLKRAQDHIVSETVNREALYAVQTPQGFRFDALLAAHREYAGQQLTDDAAVMEHAGHKVALVAGEKDNIKLTTKEDLDSMHRLLSLGMETRTGIGYDVHTLRDHDADTPTSQQQIKLCGIRIPSSHYLHGHSDADVGLHAVVDAMLGAIGAGDIGMHFPPDDPQWKGAESERFVMHAYELLKQRGGELMHLDITLICEKPKVGPHREAMQNHIAQILKLDIDRVNVKATTTEKLGFAGRGEGIAAQAVATVRLPRR